jgi:hypothetical protein
VQFVRQCEAAARERLRERQKREAEQRKAALSLAEAKRPSW